MTREDILAFAIERELEAARYYGDAAKVVSDEAARHALEGLVAEEEGHARRLKAMTGTLPAGALPEDQKSASLMGAAEGATLSPLDATTDMRDVLRHAIDREVEARELYEVFAHLVGGGAFADLLGELAEEEGRHEAGFRRLLSGMAVDTP